MTQHQLRHLRELLSKITNGLLKKGYFFKDLFEMKSDRDERGRIEVGLWRMVHSSMATTARAAQGPSQEPGTPTGSPTWMLMADTWTICSCFPRNVNGELVWRRSSWDSTSTLMGGAGVLAALFHLYSLHHNAGPLCLYLGDRQKVPVLCFIL